MVSFRWGRQEKGDFCGPQPPRSPDKWAHGLKQLTSPSSSSRFASEPHRSST
ncbi:hypothetical protein COLO4_27296 [Corchorus olitorius]|uniref:Uncharacterized protein n=1 Tax=Corchorus olitorius TaxID=93759 RepID=A0A1R3HRS6_9ROSI|nr:hypothetical protein COLO4_27296 [Corchorus olitorius]